MPSKRKLRRQVQKSRRTRGKRAEENVAFTVQDHAALKYAEEGGFMGLEVLPGAFTVPSVVGRGSFSHARAQQGAC